MYVTRNIVTNVSLQEIERTEGAAFVYAVLWEGADAWTRLLRIIGLYYHYHCQPRLGSRA